MARGHKPPHFAWFPVDRARIGLAASKGDWPRRIAEYARDDQEDAAAYAANY